MSIEVTLYADATKAALAAFASLAALSGRRYFFPAGTRGFAIPSEGLLVARDMAASCLDLAAIGDEARQEDLGVGVPDHPGLPRGTLGFFVAGNRRFPRELYPPPSRRALGALRHLARTSAARVWLECEHERGDDPYDHWIWLFHPPTTGRPATEMVFAYGGDAGRIEWECDVIGPEPWRMHDGDPRGSPDTRLREYLGRSGEGALPVVNERTKRRFERFAF